MNGHCGRPRRLERTLHPRAHVGHIVASEMDAAVGLPQRGECLVRRVGLRSPRAAIPRHARPRHRKSGLEFGWELRMHARAVLECEALDLNGWTRAHGAA